MTRTRLTERFGPMVSSQLVVAAVQLVLGAAVAAACVSDIDCPPGTPYCVADQCIECLLALDCPPEAPFCDASDGRCSACSSDGDCARFAGTPVCTTGGGCGECSATNALRCADTTPVCDVAAATCTGCASNDDCIESVDGPLCTTDGSCGPELPTCGEEPQDSCGEASRSLLRIRVSERATRNSVQWRWLGGSTALADFGDPMTTNDYSICVYRAGLPFLDGRVRRSASQWRWTGNGFRFRHRDHPEGLQRLTLISGSGKAKIVLRGKGIYLAPPELPVDGAPILVQLVRNPATDGVCWQSAFSAPYTADTAASFRAKAAD